VLRAAEEAETAQGNIQDWLQLDEGDPELQLQIEEEIAALKCFIYFHQHSQYYQIFHSFVS
jgi:hypothetical protein